MWLCRCKCGHESWISRSNLISGQSTQCMACAHAARKKSPEAESKLREKLRKRWHAHIVDNCEPEWEDFYTFYEWARTREHHKHLCRHCYLEPHGPDNTFFSDELESALITRDRVISIIMSKGATEAAATARVDNMSRQRRTQILWVAEGRCSICGEPRGVSASTRHCMACYTKDRNRERRKQGWTEDKIAAKPIVVKGPRDPKGKKIRKPPGTCRRCMEPAVQQKFCQQHYEEHLENARISQRMKKYGWTREQALAWPKGKHVK